MGGVSPALIDFVRQPPELVRGIPPRPRDSYNWDALSVVIDHTSQSDSQLKRARLRKEFLRGVKRNGVECMAPQLRYNYCRARLALGDFTDYWGWEFRDAGANGEQWSAHMYWEETWLPKWGVGLPFEAYWPGAGHIGRCNRLLILGEQGVGDAVFAASMIPEALKLCNEVIYECDERLHALLERSFPGLKCRSERPFEDRRAEYGKIDAFVPSFELLRMFRRSRQAFPGVAYLKPDEKRVAEFEKYRGRVGVAWVGRQGSIDPMALELAHPVSVQYKHLHRDIEQAPVDLWHDIDGVVAFVSVLAKVVTVPQSVHHFAGAVGTRVEIIVPDVPNEEAMNLSPWDYSTAYNGGKLLWYPDAQVYANSRHWKAKAGRR